MTELRVAGEDLVLRLSTLEKVGSIHGDVTFPRTSVESATVVENAWAVVQGIRAPGVGVPGHARLGTYRSPAGKDFVDVRHGDPGVVLTLTGQEFERIVLSFPTEAEAAELVSQLAAP